VKMANKISENDRGIWYKVWDDGVSDRMMGDGYGATEQVTE
jgi:hypothetical protein